MVGSILEGADKFFWEDFVAAEGEFGMVEMAARTFTGSSELGASVFEPNLE